MRHLQPCSHPSQVRSGIALDIEFMPRNNHYSTYMPTALRGRAVRCCSEGTIVTQFSRLLPLYGFPPPFLRLALRVRFRAGAGPGLVLTSIWPKLDYPLD
eukprot:1186417-Prorocentrum_minimum.AAC.1